MSQDQLKENLIRLNDLYTSIKDNGDRIQRMLSENETNRVIIEELTKDLIKAMNSAGRKTIVLESDVRGVKIYSIYKVVDNVLVQEDVPR